MSAANQKDTNSKGWKFQRKRVNPSDLTDLPFLIHGVQLRWISGRKNENRHMAGIWKVLRKADLPQELVRDLERDYIGMFGDGDTIRNGDLVLAYAPAEMAAARKKELTAAANDQAARVFRKPADPTAKGELTIDRKETGIGMVGGEEFFNNK